jgi:S-DNA-T family DNA segregation ATPase FtsK/SpoIIIE
MAKTTKKALKGKQIKAKESKSWVLTAQNRTGRSFHLIFCCAFLLVTFASLYFRRSKCRFQLTEPLGNSSKLVGVLALFGRFNYKGFGLYLFSVVRLFFLDWTLDYLVFLQTERASGSICTISFVYFIWFLPSLPELGTVGYELNLFLRDYIGKTGTH